jgi:hypothetical protein
MSDANPHREWARSPKGRVAEVAAFAAILTCVIVRSSRGSIDEHSFTPAPPEPAPSAPPVDPVIVPGFHFARTFDVSSFRRGNLHTHSNRSDGDSSPAEVYAWYRAHGYDFIAITDHNMLTDPGDYAWLQDPHFVAIAGEEVTMQGAGRQVHVNALCIDRRLAGGRFLTAKDALLHGVAEIRQAGGIALVNHPNFTWGLKATDLPAAEGAGLLEIHSGHPYVATFGDSSHPSHEALWDIALTGGLDFMGVAVDDTHHLHRPNRTRASHPGQAWVEVFADTLDEATICRALSQGQLYSSTGPSLLRIRVDEGTYSIWPAEGDARVQFIGSGGRLLAAKKLGPTDDAAEYKLLGSEGYVRARITNKEGKIAWTPAIRVQRAEGQINAAKALPGDRPPPPG